MPVCKSYDVETAGRGHSTIENDSTYNRYWILRLMTFMALSCLVVELCLIWSSSTNPVSKPGAQIGESRRTPKNLVTIEEKIDEVLIILKQIRHDEDIWFQKQENESNSTATVNGTQNSGLDTPSKKANNDEDKKIDNSGETTISAGKSQSMKSSDISPEIPKSRSSSESTAHGIGHLQNESDSTTRVNGTQNSGLDTPSKKSNNDEDKKIENSGETTISAGKSQSMKSSDISPEIPESRSSSEFTAHGIGHLQNESDPTTRVNGTRNSGLDTPPKKANNDEDKKIDNSGETTISAGKSQSMKSSDISPEIPKSRSSSESTAHGIGHLQNESDSTTRVNGTQNSGLDTPSKKSNNDEDKKIENSGETTISAGKSQSMKSSDISPEIPESRSSSEFTAHGIGHLQNESDPTTRVNGTRNSGLDTPPKKANNDEDKKIDNSGETTISAGKSQSMKSSDISPEIPKSRSSSESTAHGIGHLQNESDPTTRVNGTRNSGLDTPPKKANNDEDKKIDNSGETTISAGKSQSMKSSDISPEIPKSRSSSESTAHGIGHLQNESDPTTRVNGTRNSGLDTPPKKANNDEDKKIDNSGETTISAGKSQNMASSDISPEIPESGSSSESTAHGIGNLQNESDPTTRVNGTQNSGLDTPSKKSNNDEDEKIENSGETTISAGKSQSMKSSDISPEIPESGSSSQSTMHGEPPVDP